MFKCSSTDVDCLFSSDLIDFRKKENQEELLRTANIVDCYDNTDHVQVQSFFRLFLYNLFPAIFEYTTCITFLFHYNPL